jgi:prophage maintenance system killer protein
LIHLNCFDFFVDGRFHKKYDGWIGYENGEKGSVEAMLNGFSYMMDNFDLTMGIRPGYLLELHKVCMTGVQTRNPKSSPGDLRFLNAGMPFFAKTTTLENLQEILEMRRGDNTALFNNKAYAKTAEQLNADELYHALLQGIILNYRNWYPNLDEATRTALAKKDDIEKFYQAKHKVQIQFARRVNNIVAEFNLKMVEISDQESRLWAIAQLIRELELLHPFSDGNCRTFACVLLTQLLLNYEFTPAILENPNLDGECSLAQWVDEIKKGMRVTQTLLKDPEATVFGYSIRTAQPEHIRQFGVMSKDFVQKIHSHTEIFLTPARLRQYTEGQWLSNCPDFLRFSGVGTENTYSRGNIYFAFSLGSLKKEGKNVQQFLTRVTAKGIKALVLDNPEYAGGWGIPVLLVENAFAAFKTVAAQVRRDLNPFTILVTGTEGKTGAKVQLHHVMNFQARAHGVLNSANTEVPVLRSLANLKPTTRSKSMRFP